MSFKSTFLLFGVLIGALWVFGLALALKKGVADEGFVLPSLHDDASAAIAIDAVEINHDGKKYLFTRGDAGWKVSLPPSQQQVRAEDFKVDRIVEQVKEARKNDEADVTRDLGTHGLEPPRGTVTLKKKGGGKEWTLNLGNKSPDKAFVYVNSSDRPKDVMAVRASGLDSVFIKNVNDLRSRTLLEVTDQNAQKVSLTEPKGKDVSFQKTDQGGWRFEKPPYGAADFEGTTVGKQKHEGVKDLLNAISTLRVDSSEDFEPLGKTRPLADYGLEEGKEKLRIEVTSAAGFGGPKKAPSHVLLIGDKVKDDKGKDVEKDKTKGMDKEKDKARDRYYVRVQGDPSVARIDAKKLEPIFKVLSDPKLLRSYDVAQIEPTSADAIDITHGKETVKLRRPEPTLWKVFTAGDIPRKANTIAIEGDRGLLASLQGKRQIKEFFDAHGPEEIKKLEAKLGLDTPVAEVKVWVGGLAKEEAKDTKKMDAKGKVKVKDKDKDKEAKTDQKPPETEPKFKADAKPALTLRFGKTDKELVYMKREAGDGTVSWMAVPRDILQKVTPPNGGLAFLDPTVPGFPVDDVTKLDLVRGAEKFEVVRDKEPKREWILKEPKDLPNRTTADARDVDQVLDLLARLTAKKWVKKVDPKDAKALASFGLDAPALTATATIKKTGEDKGEPHVFKFGKDTDVAGDKPGVYGIEGNSDLVFLIDPSTVKTLREIDLRDRTVFKDFDAEKVKEIKLAIRKDKDSVTTPVFEKNADTGAWVIKSGLDDFTLDENKVEDLVHLLAGCAEQYVSFKGPPKAEFKLGEKEAPFRVEVLMADGKTKHELTIGAAKEKTGYYAQSNSLPGVVFLVPYARFTPILGGVTYFSKNAAAE